MNFRIFVKFRKFNNRFRKGRCFDRSEVIIHVCDEVKHIRRDFTCNQKMLVEKMGYFAEVTAGQRLEDMDISVHCDIGVFEWLMSWINPAEEKPVLDVNYVIPVLVSSTFLQMEPLIQNCLLFCHQHMNEILRTSTNLSCLNDAVITRLAAMYINSEIELLKDRKDKIQSRLYCKLIQSLCEPEKESVRGHWSSLARVFRCGHCQQLVNRTVGLEIPCVPVRMKLLCDGSVNYLHEQDSEWNINAYISQLLKSLKTWRKIYWHLWGDAHFLYCTVCKRYFSANQIGWCRFHPDLSQFFTVEAHHAPLPIGRYPCCGEKSYRFEIIQHESGCQFRDHTPANESVRDSAVLSIIEKFRNLIEQTPPNLVFPEHLTRLVAKACRSGGDTDTCDGTESSDNFWWEGFELIPTRPKLGLLGNFNDKKICANKTRSPSPPPKVIEEEDDEESLDDSELSGFSDSHNSAEKLEENDTLPQKELHNLTIKKRHGRLWQFNVSARSNQDLQRGSEEIMLKEITTLLGRRTLLNFNNTVKSSRALSRSSIPSGGVWVRLENEWRDRQVSQQQRSRGPIMGKTKIKATRLL